MTTRTDALLETYTRHDVTFERGEGVRLYDTEGREYLDLLAGIAVCVLGHAHPELTEAIRRQAGRLLHVSNFFSTPEGNEAARVLVDRIAPGQVFFCNSGAEANEAAIKLMRKHAYRRGEEGRHEIVVLEGSFHGRTLGALAATIQPKKWEGFQPLPPGFVAIPPDDVDALDRAITDRTAGVLCEPILGEGGVRPLSDGFLRTARELTRERGALLVCDEVQTGMGRTGSWWAFQAAGVIPDAVTVAKGLGGGVPVGALWVSEGCAGGLGPGDHATTFGGNPLVSAAVLATIGTIDREDLVAHAERLGASLARQLEPLGEGVRGRGLLLALELGRPVAADVVKVALRDGLVVNNVTPTAIRLAPPLILSADEAAEGVERLRAAIEEVG